MKHLQLFENFNLINESLEIASLAKKLVAHLKQAGLQVGLQYNNAKVNAFLARWDGQQTSYIKGERAAKTQDVSKKDEVNIYCDINKDNESLSKIGIGFPYLANKQASSFVGNFVKSLKEFMGPLADTLEVKSPLGWTLDEFESKINQIIQKDGYFKTSSTMIVISPKKQAGKNKEQYKMQSDKVLGLKKGKVEDNGKYDLYGSAFLVYGDESQKQREIAILAANEKTKKVSLSNYLNYESGAKNKIEALKQLAKNYAKKMGYTYVESQDQINKA